MSILIRGMEMPLPGQDIEIAEGLKGAVYARLTPSTDDEWHKVIKVPAHGRLIDADRLVRELKNIMSEDDPRFVELMYITGQPTVIEEER